MGKVPKSARKASEQKRILVVDDHPMIREHLAELIARGPGLFLCGEAEDCHPALALVEAKRPHLVIVDLSLRSSYGLDLLKDLQVRHPEVLTLVFTMHEEAFLAERAMRAGARGFVSKAEPSEKLMAAIRTVLNGGVYLSETLALQLASKVAQNPKSAGTSSIDLLTDRELRVFQLLGEGRGTRAIANELKLHITTIETYRARIKEKLQLKNADELRQEAIRWSQSGGKEKVPL